MEEKILAAFLPAKDRFEKLDFVLGTSSAPSRVNRDSREDFEVPSDALHDSIITVDFNPSAPTRASNRGLKPQMSQSSSFESTAVTIDHGGKSSVFAASFNFVNSIVGAGIIGNSA